MVHVNLQRETFETYRLSLLRQVKESLVSEQSRTGTLDLSLSQLNGSVSVILGEVSGLKDRMQRVSSSFKSLLTDVIRHSDVLELLLGDEVLEFLEWSEQAQVAHSIPALKQQLKVHDLKITSLEESRTGNAQEEAL